MVSSTVVSAATPTGRHGFDARVDAIKPSKSDINHVIMDYLVSEGYPMAAKRFAIEANIPHGVEPQSIQERVDIRNAIHAGNIESAIHRINDLNPQILDHDPALHFALLRLQLIELIRKCMSSPNADITPALTFATSELAPRAPTNQEFLEDLERTMALLIFPPENLAPPLAQLLDPSLRQTVATRVNEAILSSQGASREARIKQLVRLRAWSEQKAREARKDIPTTLSLGLDSEKTADDDDELMNNGNGEADVMRD
ncbi:CTLH/CRA C-terminal to lish motif domain-containing protein [Macrophomina phaseolina]|uniref:CTLH/CRA C-terminal to lish motif domain-containing protein n=1 Tax=Macrophomina phaseolina TaxID=35725 RepID=A0ABQ8GSC4_9PEZI|nr:CTLH/CRA C-terminal to lish motif domain-containing protein [Macrophomina phaseolina]